MIKKLTIALLLFITSGSVFSQASKFRFGISGNTGYAWLKPTTKGLSTNGGQAALGYGLMFDYNLGENYAISTGLEINYRGGGLNFNLDEGKAIGFTKVDLQYIEIPLQLKMKTKAIGYFTYFTSFGGSLGYTLNRMGTYSLTEMSGGLPTTATPILITDDNLKKYLNPLSISLLINLGTEYNISGKTSIYGSIFFNNSFLDIMTDPSISKSYEMSSRANVIGLKLGIFF